MKTIIILFPVAAGMIWALTSVPFIACLAGVVVAAMVAGAVFGMWDHVTTEIGRYR